MQVDRLQPKHVRVIGLLGVIGLRLGDRVSV